MKKIILAISTLAILAGPALGITYRKPVTAHQQLTSTGTLTHASLESTLTAVNAATTTLKGITDAHAATLAQVGVDTATLAGLVGSGAGDNLGNHVATTTLNMGGNVIDGVTRINTPFDYDIGWYKPLIIGGDTSQGFATGVRVINYNSPSYMGNSELTMQWLGNPFLYFNDGGWNSYFKGIYYYDPTVSSGTPALNISSNNVVMFGNCTAPYFYGDVSNCMGYLAGNIDAGTLADGVKVTTANVQATGTPDGTKFLRGDGAWATPSGSGDMVQATHGVAIAESTATLRSDVTAIQSTLTTVGASTETLRTNITGTFSTVGTATATLRSDLNAVIASTGVHKIIAGTNITISPTSGQGDITINASPSTGAGDNLGNHTATTTLEMGNYALKSSSCIYIGTPFENGYDLAVVGDVLFSTGTLYLRDTTLLLSDTTGLFMVLVDSVTHQTEMYVEGGSTLSIAGVGGNKINVDVDGNVYADNIYGHFVDTKTINVVFGDTTTVAGNLVNLQSWIRIPWDCTIKSWYIKGDQSGSIVVDVATGTLSGTTYTSIAGTEKPTLSSAVGASDTDLTTWTVAVAKDTWLQFVVESASTLKQITVQLEVLK